MRNLLFHLIENWADLVRSERDPDVPDPPNRIEGWFGHFKPRVRLARGLRTEAGASTSYT